MPMNACLMSLLVSMPFVALAEESKPVDLVHFRRLLSPQPEDVRQSMHQIAENWQDGYTPLLIESLRFAQDPPTQRQIRTVLHEKTGLKKKSSLTDLWQHVWSQPIKNPHPKYSTFKAQLYRLIDPRFEEYFDEEPESTIRLDEIRWGGVYRDGIPPLKDPKLLKASEADYLDDRDVVFGVYFNGKARAYPKRILAWHEMVKDVVGGKSINGVYCTLCGSMIVYDTRYEGKHYELGTSGFLYRSNKLMYDHKTQSMWSTIEGKPVVGPLVGKGIQLAPLTVVTTNWGEWKSRHPETTVLSLETGHQRDYGEGVAYERYFSTHELMFEIPTHLKDERLKNKESILALRFGDGPKDKVAFSPALLRKNPVYVHRHEQTSVVILTDKSGASRVYQTEKENFVKWDQKKTAVDDQGTEWIVTERALIDSSGKTLSRYPSHNAFWFGWRSAYPETHLIQ